MKKEKTSNLSQKTGVQRVFSNNMLMLRYVFRYTPIYGIVFLLFKILFGAGNVLNNIFIVKYVLDAVQFQRPVMGVVISILLIVAYNISLQVANSFFVESYVPRARERLFYKMQLELLQKAAKMELACYDNPQFYNDFIWATSQADRKANDVLDKVGNALQSVTTISGITSVILTLDPLGLIFVLASFICTFLINLRVNRLKIKQDEELRPVQRKRDYISRVFYLTDYAKEIRLNSIKDRMTLNFKESNSEMIAVTKKYVFQQLSLNFMDVYLSNTLVMDCVYMLVLAYKALVLKNISYGTFCCLLNGVSNMKSSLQSLVRTLLQFQEQSLYIEKFRTFLEYEPQMIDSQNALEMSEQPGMLQLRDVSFTYDGADTPTLKNISLTIKPYEKIALVGYNGAGKTTLIKLLMRLYDVSEGAITVDGVDIRDFRIKSYRDSFGVVFQDYQLFAANIAENVAMDVVKEEHSRIVDALDQSGFSAKLAQLDDGVHTPLTREFDSRGINLSGGEAQKVAIARVFYKPCQYIILDEPSSALDPISEYHLNQVMLEAAKQKTVIFISHRLSTTRMADRIYMLERGEIIEQGTHEELIRQNGKYAEMFNLQAEKYRV